MGNVVQGVVNLVPFEEGPVSYTHIVTLIIIIIKIVLLMNSSFIHTQKYHNIQTCIICIKLQFYQQFSLSRNKITKQFLRTNSDLIETLNVKRCLTLMDCLFENANVFMYFGLASTLKRSKTENCYKQCFENENRSLSTVERPFKIGFRKR